RKERSKVRSGGNGGMRGKPSDSKFGKKLGRKIHFDLNSSMNSCSIVESEKSKISFEMEKKIFSRIGEEMLRGE
ncbi:hypothetical protein KBC86_00930, partial [Candidatus Gracilibacteria bacterium]|nr:hypothetical protein [Candidatus Gracilibacteria bacterium]